MSEWRAFVLAVWITAITCVVVALEDRGWTWRRLMKVKAWQVLLSGFVGIVVGLMLAPPIAAMRPRPDPIVQRVPIYTADVIDTGSACVYAWQETVFLWQWSDIGPRVNKACPSKNEAEARWRQANHAPVAVQQEKAER